MKKILAICLTVTAIALAGFSAKAQDVPSDTIGGHNNPQGQPSAPAGQPAHPRDSVYKRKPATTPRDTVHRQNMPSKPQPGSQNNNGANTRKPNTPGK